MVVSQLQSIRKEAETVPISHLPRAPGFRCWKLAHRDEFASAPGAPDDGYAWIFKVERPGITFDDLESCEEFPSLDAKLAAAFSKVVQGDLSHRINPLKDQLAAQRRLVKGRQILLMVCQHNQINAAEGAILDFVDLLNVRLHRDDLRSFLADGETVLPGIAKTPENGVLEALFKKQLSSSAILRDQLACYDRFTRIAPTTFFCR